MRAPRNGRFLIGEIKMTLIKLLGCLVVFLVGYWVVKGEKGE